MILLLTHRKFWSENPALLLAICILIGSSSYLFWPSPLNLLFPALWALYLIAVGSWPLIILLVASIFYCTFLYPKVPTGTTGYFSITSLQPYQSPFQKGLLYKGAIFIDGQKVPCHVHHSSINPPKANCDYILEGALVETAPYNYLFKAKKWTPIKRTWSFAQYRFQLKERLRLFLEEKLQRPKTAIFLGSLLTGDVQDRALRFEFSRLGLQHILAVSGFHFAILIAFCSFFLSYIFSNRWKIIVLLLAIHAYFFFVGPLPAVQRSWLIATLYLTGKLISRHSSALNLLGVALLIELILDPLISSNLGFQLSFTSCFGLLLLSPHLNFQIQQSPNGLSNASCHIYLISNFWRKAFSLTLAVNLALLPLLLTHFHKFPLLSILYNLFFPFLVSIAMFILLISLIVHLFSPPIAAIFFQIVDLFTSQILELSTYPPIALDYSIHTPSFPGWIIPFYLFALFCLTNRLHSGNISGFYGDRSSVG